MDPKIVTQAPNAPGQCLFSQDIDGPFIDTGNWAHWVDPYGYISVAYVRSLATNLLGMVDRGVVDELKVQLAQLQEDCADLRKFVDATEAVDEAKKAVAA